MLAVAVAADPQAGYDAVAKEKPSLMILDAMLPERGAFLDGFSLLETLHREKKTDGLPIIMISALGNLDDLKRGMDLGATDFLPKQDLLPKRLLDLIAKHLQK